MVLKVTEKGGESYLLSNNWIIQVIAPFEENLELPSQIAINLSFYRDIN